MAAVRGHGNKTTEWAFRAGLMRAGVSGWTMHARDLPGRPDFVFRKKRLAIFIDGCFWHGCAACSLVPKKNIAYWGPKLKRNRARDRNSTASLRRRGFKVLRIWEHQIVADCPSALRLLKQRS